MLLDVWSDLSVVIDFLVDLPLVVWLASAVALISLGLVLSCLTPRQPRDTLDASGNASVSIWRPIARALGRLFFP